MLTEQVPPCWKFNYKVIFGFFFISILLFADINFRSKTWKIFVQDLRILVPGNWHCNKAYFGNLFQYILVYKYIHILLRRRLGQLNTSHRWDMACVSMDRFDNLIHCSLEKFSHPKLRRIKKTWFASTCWSCSRDFTCSTIDAISVRTGVNFA